MHIHSISVCTQALLEVSLFSKGELCFLFNLSVADHERHEFWILGVINGHVKFVYYNLCYNRRISIILFSYKKINGNYYLK